MNTAWVRARIGKLQKGCIRLAAASDKVYQLLAHGYIYQLLPFNAGKRASFHAKFNENNIFSP
jgi:hypothetical protein